MQIDDVMEFLNVVIKNEKLLSLILQEFLAKSDFIAPEELYEKVKELF